MHPFRFGIQCRGPADGDGWRDLARRVEDLGWSTLTIADHFDDALAPIPGLMAAADATTTLRVGSMVLANDYRHPVVLAKEAATLDVLTGGRFDLGIGAGWMTTDYEAAGVPLDRPGLRIERLAEALAVLRGLWSDEPCTFAGDHYRVDGARRRTRSRHTRAGRRSSSAVAVAGSSRWRAARRTSSGSTSTWPPA